MARLDDVADWVRGSHTTMTEPVPIVDASAQSALLRTPSLTYSAFDSPRSSVFTSLTTPPASPFECASELADASEDGELEVIGTEGRSPYGDDDAEFFAEWERDVKRYTAKRGRRAGVKNRANLARKDAARRAMSLQGGFDAAPSYDYLKAKSSLPELHTEPYVSSTGDVIRPRAIRQQLDRAPGNALYHQFQRFTFGSPAPMITGRTPPPPPRNRSPFAGPALMSPPATDRPRFASAGSSAMLGAAIQLGADQVASDLPPVSFALGNTAAIWARQPLQTLDAQAQPFVPAATRATIGLGLGRSEPLAPIGSPRVGSVSSACEVGVIGGGRLARLGRATLAGAGVARGSI